MKCYDCGISLEEGDRYVDFETCVDCGNNFCEVCEDCMATNVDDDFCKRCAEEITGFTEEDSGAYRDDEDFAQQLLEDIGDIPRNFPFYIHIDWEATARDIMMDYCEHNGHYFRIF